METKQNRYTFTGWTNRSLCSQSRCFRVFVAIFLYALLSGGAYAAEAPRGFSSNQYSSTAGELFWERPTRSVTGFELTRNGVNLGIFDALSYYDDTLEPGTLYTYTIAAVELDGTRSAVAAVELGTQTATPFAPQGFRATVYSPTAAEVFWDQTNEPGIVYEVTLDDDKPEITDGSSLFLNALDPGTTYRVSLRSVNQTTGAASAAQEILFTTDNDPASAPPGLEPPSNVRFQIYSSTAAEFFWDRVENDALQYEITLNDELVDGFAPSDGTSIYLDTLVPGSSNTISIVALDELRGRRSASADVTFDMPLVDDSGVLPPTQPDPTGSPISEENIDNVLSKIFDIIEDYGHQKVEAALGDFRFTEPDDPLPGLTLSSNESFVVSGTRFFRRIYECADGGNFIHEPRLNAFGDAGMIFEDCTLPGFTRNGSVTIVNFDGVSTTNTYDAYKEVQIDPDTNESIIIELTGEAGSGGARVGDLFSEFATLDYALKTQAGKQHVNGLQQDFIFDSNAPSPNVFSTNFEVQGFWTKGVVLQVETINQFQTTDTDSVYYELGLFRITDIATQANYIEFDAETGDIETYQLTVVIGNTVISEIRSWDDLP